MSARREDVPDRPPLTAASHFAQQKLIEEGARAPHQFVVRRADLVRGRIVRRARWISRRAQPDRNRRHKDGAVTTSKLHKQAVTTGKLANNAVRSGNLANNAVTTSKLAPNAVTGAQVKDGSLTASDVAPYTFLAANGTASNSLQLGGVPANGFVQGAGSLSSGRVMVPVGQINKLLDVGLGTLFGDVPSQSPDRQPDGQLVTGGVE